LSVSHDTELWQVSVTTLKNMSNGSQYLVAGTPIKSTLFNSLIVLTEGTMTYITGDKISTGSIKGNGYEESEPIKALYQKYSDSGDMIDYYIYLEKSTDAASQVGIRLDLQNNFIQTPSFISNASRTALADKLTIVSQERLRYASTQTPPEYVSNNEITLLTSNTYTELSCNHNSLISRISNDGAQLQLLAYLWLNVEGVNTKHEAEIDFVLYSDSPGLKLICDNIYLQAPKIYVNGLQGFTSDKEWYNNFGKHDSVTDGAPLLKIPTKDGLNQELYVVNFGNFGIAFQNGLAVEIFTYSIGNKGGYPNGGTRKD
jgi:hypothetical protein